MRKRDSLAINLRPTDSISRERIHQLRGILRMVAEQDMTTISQAVARLIEQEGRRRDIIAAHEPQSGA